MKTISFLVAALLVASVAFAAPTRLKFNPYSTATGTTCSVVGSDLISNKRAENTDLIPNVSSARVYNLGTKSTGTFSSYSTSLASSYVWISCYKTTTGEAAAARIFFDTATTVNFPLTDKILRVR